MCMFIPPSRLIEIYLEVIKPVGVETSNQCRILGPLVEYEIESDDETYVDSSVEESTEDEEDDEIREGDEEEQGAEGDQVGGSEAADFGQGAKGDQVGGSKAADFGQGAEGDELGGDEGATQKNKGKGKQKGKGFAPNKGKRKETAYSQTEEEEPQQPGYSSSDYDDSDVERMPRVDAFDPKLTEQENQGYPEFREGVLEDTEFKLGMTFTNVTEVRAGIRNHGIKHGRKVYLKKNLSNKIQAKCVEPCTWYFYAAKQQRELTFKITRLQKVYTYGR